MRNPFQLYNLTLTMTESELEILIDMIRRILPSDKFAENLVMKIYDEANELLTSIKK